MNNKLMLTTSGVNAVSFVGSTVLASCVIRCGCPFIISSTILLLSLNGGGGGGCCRPVSIGLGKKFHIMMAFAFARLSGGGVIGLAAAQKSLSDPADFHLGGASS